MSTPYDNIDTACPFCIIDCYTEFENQPIEKWPPDHPRDPGRILPTPCNFIFKCNRCGALMIAAIGCR